MDPDNPQSGTHPTPGSEPPAASSPTGEMERRTNDFLSLLAHELRNPLAPILHAVELMRICGMNDADLPWMMDIVERQVKQMARLIDDLLEVSRVTGGKIQLHKKTIDLGTVINHAADATRSLFEARRHDLTLFMPSAPILVEGDPVRLEQVLTNLLHNAARYTEPGGHVWLSAERSGEQAVLRVRDNGLGISPRMLPQIFDLFTKADRFADRPQGGLGIGLCLVRSLLELHGGTVEAHSAGPGQGSEFVIRLPALPAPSRSEGEPKGAEPPPAQSPSRRVLVVEDNTESAEVLALLLEASGHEVQVAHDGASALEMARSQRPEVIFLDIGLPGIDGYQVAGHLRKEEGLERVLIVALTGYGREEDQRRSQAAGFDYHLVKPVDSETLEQLLASPRAEAR